MYTWLWCRSVSGEQPVTSHTHYCNNWLSNSAPNPQHGNQAHSPLQSNGYPWMPCFAELNAPSVHDGSRTVDDTDMEAAGWRGTDFKRCNNKPTAWYWGRAGQVCAYTLTTTCVSLVSDLAAVFCRQAMTMPFQQIKPAAWTVALFDPG